MWISEHGPHGPVSPISQKLSFSPNRRIWSGAMSVCARHQSSASSSVVYTVAHSAGLGSFHTSVSNSQAQAIASFL